jgi:hypothetical protein
MRANCITDHESISVTWDDDLQFVTIWYTTADRHRGMLVLSHEAAGKLAGSIHGGIIESALADGVTDVEFPGGRILLAPGRSTVVPFECDHPDGGSPIE